MILLDTTTRRLRILLGAAGAIRWITSYVEITTATQSLTSEAANTGVTNGTTPVDLVGVPGAGVTRQVKLFWVQNTTGAGASLTIRYDDNGIANDTTFAMDASDLLQYTDGEGFRLFDSSGKMKVTGGSGSIVFAGGLVKGGVYINATSASDVAIWRANLACTVTAVKAYRGGGTTATCNARRNGTSEHLASDVTAGAASWADGGAVQNTAYVVGDSLEIRLKSVTGTPAEVAVQVEFSVP